MSSLAIAASRPSAGTGWCRGGPDGDGTTSALTETLAGRPSSYTYPSGAGNGGNGTYTDTLVYDDLGRPSGLTWRQAGGAPLSSDQHTYTLAGRLADQTIDGTDANGSVTTSPTTRPDA